MKILKLTTGILIMLMISSSMVFSQTNKTVTTQNSNTVQTTSVNTGPGFVDKNHDGICDKHQNSQVKECKFVDKNNDGICDNCGKTKADCNNCKGNQKNCKSKCSTTGQGKCCEKGKNAIIKNN